MFHEWTNGGFEPLSRVLNCLINYQAAKLGQIEHCGGMSAGASTNSLETFCRRAVVVAQLEERLLPTPEGLFESSHQQNLY